MKTNAANLPAFMIVGTPAGNPPKVRDSIQAEWPEFSIQLSNYIMACCLDTDNLSLIDNATYKKIAEHRLWMILYEALGAAGAFLKEPEFSGEGTKAYEHLIDIMKVTNVTEIILSLRRINERSNILDAMTTPMKALEMHNKVVDVIRRIEESEFTIEDYIWAEHHMALDAHIPDSANSELRALLTKH